MSRKPDDLDLMAIRELGKSSKKVQDLIQEKNREVRDIEKTEVITYKKYDPAPKPNGDIRITKKHTKEIRSPEQTKQEIEKTEERYAKDIKSALKERAQEIKEDHFVTLIENMDNRDASILVEKGLNAYKERQLEKRAELEMQLEYNLDDPTLVEQYPIYLDYDDNSKDIVRETPTPSEPVDDFE